MTKNILYLLIILFLFPFYVSGQNEEKPANLLSNWSVHLKYGIPLLQKIEPTYSSFETSIGVRPSTHVILGLGYRYFFKEKLSLDLDLSYEYASFLRLEEYSYQRSTNRTVRSGERYESFKNHSLFIPIKLTRHLKRTSLSIGIANTFHLASEVNIRHRFFVDGVFSSEILRHYTHGDRIVTGSGAYIDRTNVYLESKINIQALVGMNYRLSNRLSLNFELRQYLTKNRLVRELSQYDVANLSYTYYYPFTPTFSAGMRFNFNYKELK